MKIPFGWLVVAAVAVAANAPVAADESERRLGQEADRRAMRELTGPLIGVWGPPEDTAENRSPRLVFEWVIPDQIARFSEWRRVGATATRIGEALLGYDYRSQRVEWIGFQRDDAPGVVEATHHGLLEPGPGGAIVRRLRAVDPDTSSREYRETFRFTGEGALDHTIEYLTYGGEWKSWGTFRLVRRPPLDTAP
ncbi:MAG: hypothetical protein ACREI7_02235 [Myxococcota bacterium]